MWVVLKDAFAGIFEYAQRVVGMENLLLVMAIDEILAGVLFDKLLELKLDYWRTALAKLGDVVTYAPKTSSPCGDVAGIPFRQA